MKTAKELREERASTWEQMLSVEKNGEERGGMNAEDKEQWDRLEARLNELTEDVTRAEKREQHASVDYDGVIDSRGEGRGSEVVDDAGNTRDDYTLAFDMWARYGSGELTSEQRKILREGAVSASELRAQGVSTGAAGGFTVPDLFRNKLVEVLKDFSGVRQVAEHITTDTGANLPWPTNDDTGNEGSILGENTQDTELDLTFGDNSLDVFMYTSKIVRVSIQLLQDNAVNLESFLPRKLGERIGRVQNRHFTVGTGSGQPLGLITGGTAVAAATGNVTGFDYDSFIDAQLRIDPAFALGANLKWMTSQTGVGVLRKIKDADGRPMWQPSLLVGQPDSFLGNGIVVNNHMAVPAANAKSFAYGDFGQGYVVRDVLGLQVKRLEERYADFLQVGWLAFQRSGGTVQDTQAYTVLQNSAT